MMKLLEVQKLVALYKRLSKREKIILYAAAIFVSVLAGDQLILQPIAGTFQSLDQEAGELQSNIKKSIHLLAQKERMMKEVEYFSSFAIERKSPEEEAVALLKHIEQLASEANVNLLYAKPSATQPDEIVDKYYATLESEGQLEQMINFLYQIESSKFLLKIEKYQIQQTKEGSSIIKCSATVSKAVIP